MGSTYSCGVSKSRNALFSNQFHTIFCLLPNVRARYEAGWEAASRICFQKQFIGGYCLGYTITLRLVARVSSDSSRGAIVWRILRLVARVSSDSHLLMCSGRHCLTQLH